MNNNNLDQILREEQLKESISFLYEKMRKLDSEANEETKKMEDLQIELQCILHDKDKMEAAKPKNEVFSPVSNSFLQKNETLNDKLLGIKTKMDVKKLVIDELKKDKKQAENIIYYLEKLENLKENSSIEITEKEVMEKQHSDLAFLVFNAEENEKKRIARDLHDTTVQNLVAMIHKLELSMRVMDTDAIRAKLEIQVLIKTLQSTINDMRSMIYDLRPMSVDDIGLVMTLDKFVNQLSITNQDVQISLNIINEEIEISSLVNLNIFRIIQESCSNAIKSGKATKIDITLNYEIDNFFVTIVDNGVGFSYNDNVNGTTKNFGLSIMKERISLLDGDITIDSVIDQGTTIKIDIPISKNREIKTNHG